jgi:hypothetical protein
MKQNREMRFSSRVYIYIVALVCLIAGGCNKSDDTQGGASPTMAATINGSNITFTTTLTSSGGLTVVQGTSSRYTLTIYLKTISSSIYTLADPSTGYYATVADALGSNYSTDPVNTGQLTLPTHGLKFNGTFYFSANATSPSPGG